MALTITKNSGTVYTIANIGNGAARTFTVQQLQDDGTFEEIQAATVLNDNYYVEFTFSGDGVYQVVEQGGETYNIIIYSNVEATYLGLMKQIHNTADCGCNSSDSIKLYYYNAIAMNFYLFLAMINSTYIENWIYTAVNTDELQNLLCLSDVITKITELGEAANLLKSPCDDC